MADSPAGLIVWDVDGTLLPADLRWLRRAVARTYGLPEDAVVFPVSRVHGYTDESIVVDTAICSGVAVQVAEAGITRFHTELSLVMAEGREELARDQQAYPGAAQTISALHRHGFVQTVLTGNLKAAAEKKLTATGLAEHLALDIGAFGSDARDRFDLPAVLTRRFEARFRVRLNPRQTVLIGDAANDIATARHAGFHAVAVAHRAGRDELTGYRPDAILDGFHPAEVVEVVGTLLSQG